MKPTGKRAEPIAELPGRMIVALASMRRGLAGVTLLAVLCLACSKARGACEDGAAELKKLRGALDIPQPGAPECADTVLARVRMLLKGGPEPELLQRIQVALGGSPERVSAPIASQRIAEIRGILTPIDEAPQAALLHIPTKPVPHPEIPTLERSHIITGPSLAFEAQLAPHINVFESLSRHKVVEPGNQGTAVVFSPMIRLRMLNETSSPIKTLSWMPKVDFEKVLVGDTVHGAAAGPWSISEQILKLTFGHPRTVRTSRSTTLACWKAETWPRAPIR